MNEEKYLSKINTKSMVDTVVSRLTDAILNNELKPGQKIPTESELTKTFGVGRNTVREAIKTLVAYGILNIHRADGTYVADEFSPRIINPMLYGIILKKNGAYKDLIELRKLIDIGVLILLQNHEITDEEKKNISAKRIDLEQYILSGGNDSDIILEKDIYFHHEIVVCSGNDAVVSTYNTIVNITQDFQRKTIEYIQQTDNLNTLVQNHRSIEESLLHGDANSVYQVLETSYKFWFV